MLALERDVFIQLAVGSIYSWKCNSNSGSRVHVRRVFGQSLQRGGSHQASSDCFIMSQENLEVFSKDTFLTSLRNGAGNDGTDLAQGSSSKSSVDEPPGSVL